MRSVRKYGRRHIQKRGLTGCGAPTAANRGELDPVRLRTAALSWIIVTPNVARGFALS